MIEYSKGTIPADHPIHVVFRQLTERGMNQLELRDIDTIDYVTNLLIDFVHVDNMYKVRSDEGQRLDLACDILVQAGQAMSPSVRRAHYRHLGDLTLYKLGLFPESLTYGRRTVSPDFYAEQGRRSYAIVAEMETPKTTVVFRKLSEQFGRCVEGLHWVRLYIQDPFYQYMFREFQVI